MRVWLKGYFVLFFMGIYLCISEWDVFVLECGG